MYQVVKTQDFRKHNLSVPESQKESDLASKLKKRGEKCVKLLVAGIN